MLIDAALVQRLIGVQFPQWAGLPVRPVVPQGHDNRSFRIGDGFVARLPSAAAYAAQVEKEQQWLPLLGPELPLAIPQPVARGQADETFPHPWSVYRWIDGEAATERNVAHLVSFARELAAFQIALRRTDASSGPPAGMQNFHRGGSLAHYSAEVSAALALLEQTVDAAACRRVWDRALASAWRDPPVWVHGDVAPANLLVRDGRLAAVLDFGLLGVGDPACDLVLAWTFFSEPSRDAYRVAAGLDELTWDRARGWALWKGLVVASGLSPTPAPEWGEPRRVVDTVLAAAPGAHGAAST